MTCLTYLILGCVREVIDGCELALLVDVDDQYERVSLFKELCQHHKVVLLAQHLCPLVRFLKKNTTEIECASHAFYR